MVSAGLTLLVIGVMVAARLLHTYERWAAGSVTAKWLEILGGGATSLQADLPRLRRRSAFFLLRQWSFAFSKTNELDDPRAAELRRRHLLSAAHQVHMEEFALELLETGTNEEVMAAAIVLGHLRTEKAFIPLKRRADTPHGFISAAAMEALLKIDSERGLPILVELISGRSDWPDHVLARMLRDLSEHQIHGVIRGAVQSGNREAVLHLFRALERVGDEAAEVLLEWLLDRAATIDAVRDICYAALQRARLRRVLSVFHDGTERIRAIVDAASLATETCPLDAARDLTEEEPEWIRVEVLKQLTLQPPRPLHASGRTS